MTVTLPEAVRAADPATVAIIDGQRAVTYGELADLVDRTAWGLVGRGLRPGARVAIAAPPGIDGIVAYLGTLAARGVASMLYPESPTAELALRLDMIDPQFTLCAGPVDLPSGVEAFSPAGAVDADRPPLDVAPNGASPGAQPEDVAVALFTSGVAGRPRPVLLSHANLAAVQAGLIEQRGSGLGPGTVALCPMPISHVFGLNSLVGTMLRAGATIVTAPRFDPAATLELIARHRVSTLSAVPQMWAAWTAVAGSGGGEMASVERATSSAAHLPAAVAEAVYGRFGLRVAAGYGLTETAGTICLDDVANPTTDTVGRPLGGTQLRLVDPDDDEEDAEPGEPGEIWVKGPSVFVGYLGADGPSMLGPDGWCRTGDVGVFDDDGRLTIVDRVKDVIIVGGFNVAPAEVEDVLLSHPSVAGAAVVGEPDERSGERVVAYVVPSRDDLSTDQLVEHCRRHLARYKVPARIEQREQLPATESGKWVRRLLQ